jgi:hypothetical protein
LLYTLTSTQSRSLAGPSLLAYIQRYGPPETIVSDNAKELTGGEFSEICKKQGITQERSAPYNPNQNTVEHYMEIISSRTRSLLSISGLDPETYWEMALEHAVNLQLRMASPGRCTPFELTYGKQPNVINLRIFGCEALAYREKDKRVKFQPKVDQCVYMGMSTSHSDYTYKLLNLKTKKVIYRRRQDPEKNEQYRSHVGAMNGLTMCLRYDLAYTTKELSRALQEPTETANEILR